MSANMSVVKLNFNDDHKSPTFKIKQGAQYVNYGLNNTFPDYLIELARRSPMHNAILQNKVRYMSGGGIEVVSYQSVEDEVKAQKWAKHIGNALAVKIAISLEYFGGYALKIRYSQASDKLLTYTPIDYPLLRLSADLSQVIYSTEWTKSTSIQDRWRPYRLTPPEGAEYYDRLLALDLSLIHI